MENNNKIAVQIVLEGFKGTIKRASKLLAELSDEDLKQEIVIFKNTGHYLLGHLIAVSDNMLPLLGLGESLYPELAEIFIKNSDKATIEKPTITLLRKQWDEVNEFLLQKLEALTTEQWFEKHTAVSDADFAKEPHRNKLNVVLSRSSHLAYHFGQIVLLKS